MGTHGRNFLKVQREVISRTTREVVLFYYASWKGGRRYKTWKRKDKVRRRAAWRKAADFHNDVCDVCDQGGKLLCCDTCNLSFHLECLRPPLAALPEGDWSCGQCLLEMRRNPLALARARHYVDERVQQTPVERSQNAPENI